MWETYVRIRKFKWTETKKLKILNYVLLKFSEKRRIYFKVQNDPNSYNFRKKTSITFFPLI